MAKKKSLNPMDDYKHFIVPSVLGLVFAWFFSGSLATGIIVFIAVWVGCWIGYEFLRGK